MGDVDPAFIQDVEHRPNLAPLQAESIPLIDLAALAGYSPSDGAAADSAAIKGLVAEIGEACKEWGFFSTVNHGVPAEKRERIEREGREFFRQDLEEKKKVRRDEKRTPGYYETEHTKNVRDWKEVFDFTVQEPTVFPASPEDGEEGVIECTNQWPEYPPGLREACEDYAQEVQKLAHKLMGLIAQSLGLPANRFDEFFKDQTSFVRINHYPPCPTPHLVLGVGRHKDSGALAILAQDDVPGLEVKRKSDGEWVLVKPIPDSFIINVGDIIKVWSNEVYDSVEHRAIVNSKRDRISIPFFFMPPHYTMVQPLKELTDEHNPPKYRPYNWGKYRVSRHASNFKKLDVENLQIDHFRI
ncbi:probable 2-oxoglutarate-dependent dioxygenase At5g05600 [Eucalyptus grandis]|uniref:probable 2-oxoglutarate-dependent dioxygenase At5g05600 n=1 Tax=Eucalyptus grandis TaxID=71139 RepID=UPI00192ED8EB|nr:probable 2-oxoglutarate-dependent dioxygenase At5g05600 [Eucalyptus grandis]